MRKRDRHQLIKKMITEEKLSTQKEIQDRLEAHNVCVTQTTLSRDLREIGDSARESRNRESSSHETN